MRFFNFNKTRNTPQEQAGTTSDWEKVNQDTQFDPAETSPNSADSLVANQSRQERKVIGSLLHGKDIIGQADYKLSDAEEAKFYNLVNSGALTDDRKSAFLREITPPIYTKGNSPEKVFQNLNSRQELRILSTLSGHGFDGMKELQPNDLKVALAEAPTPVEFETFEQAFMEHIRDYNSPEKFREYETSMANFKQKLFGKRLEYYGAIKRLEHKAHQKQRESSARDRVLNAYNQNPLASNYPKKDLGYLSPKMQAVYQVPTSESQISPNSLNSAPESNYPFSESNREILRKTHFHILSSPEAKNYLEQGQVDGDQYIYQGKVYELSSDKLKQLGLEPKYGLSLPGANIGLSNIYKNSHGHNAVTAYVQTAKGTKVCTYYHSKSHGVWRYLPDYVAKNDPNALNVDYYGKGYSADSVTLPSETQFVLDLITQNNQTLDLDPVRSNFAFFGTAKRYNGDTYQNAQRNGQLRGDYYQEISRLPIYNLSTPNGRSNPQSLDISGSFAPVFVYPENSHYTNSNTYGRINVEQFASANNKLRYTFNRNSENHAWINNIEVNSPISSTGLHTEWIKPGDYNTPLLEYAHQSGGYGEGRHGNYVNMWNNYLSKMPIIQKYLESLEHARQYR